jgi:hypothetical protein
MYGSNAETDSQVITEKVSPRMKFQGEGTRRARIQGRGDRKAKAPIWVSGEEKALAQIHVDPRR